MERIEKLKELIRNNYLNQKVNQKLKLNLTNQQQQQQQQQEELISKINQLIQVTIKTIKPPIKTIIDQTISKQSIIKQHQTNHQQVLKSIYSAISLEILIRLNQEIRENYEIDQTQQQQPILGSNDLRAIQRLTQTIVIYSIYNPNQSIQTEGFPFFSFQETIKTLTQIILPTDLIQLINSHKNHNNHLKQIQSIISLHPRFALHQALFSNLLTPLCAGLIKLRSNPQYSHWVDQNLHQLLDLASPKLVFSSLLSLVNTLSPLRTSTTDNPHGSKNNSQAQSDISQVLSIRLLRPSGTRGLLQSVISEDYNEDDEEEEHDHQQQQQHHHHHQGKTTKTPITSATLKRFESLYHIISHLPSSVSPSVYWNTILKNLILIILPQFFDQGPRSRDGQVMVKAPDSIRRAACYILSQITTRQPAVFKTYLSPLLHLVFRPSQPTSSQSLAKEEEQEEDVEDEDQQVFTSAQIKHTLELLNQLVLNSEPSPIFVDRLVVPILPQLLSLIMFLLRTRAEPTVRWAAEELVQLWMRLHPAETVASWLGRAVRELEAGRELSPRATPGSSVSSSRVNQWARDTNGMPCVKTRLVTQTDSLDFSLNPDTLIGWFQSLKTRQFLGHLLSNWLEEVVLLRARTGFVEAKMTLFRIQTSLKILDAFEIPQIVSEPQHFFPFILHTLRLHHSSNPQSPPKSQKTNTSQQVRRDGPLTLDTLKFLNLDASSAVDQKLPQDELEDDGEEEGDVDLDHGITVAGLSLLLALLEGHPEMDEENTPGLREISALLDGLLLNQLVSSEVYELGIKSRLLLSVRKAISLVDRGQQEQGRSAGGVEEREVMKEKAGLEGRYKEGLALLNDECLPLRSQGIVQLKTVLLTPTSSGRIRDMVESWAPGVVELLLRAVEDADSFVYLSAINALSALAHRFHAIVGPALANTFAQPILAPPPSSLEPTQTAALRDFDRSVRVAEAMVQVIQRAGTALPLYIDRLLPSLLLVLHHSHPAADPLKPSALTILALCVEHAPAALVPSLSGLVQACVSILSSAGMQQASDESSGEPSGEDSAVESVEESGTESDEDPCPPRSPQDPAPIISPIHTAHHRSSLHRATLLFIQSLLSQTLSLCRSASSSVSVRDRTVVRTVRSAIGEHLVDLERVLKYLLLSPHNLHSRKQIKPKNSPLDGPITDPRLNNGLVAASLIQNALESVAVLRSVLTYY